MVIKKKIADGNRSDLFPNLREKSFRAFRLCFCQIPHSPDNIYREIEILSYKNTISA